MWQLVEGKNYLEFKASARATENHAFPKESWQFTAVKEKYVVESHDRLRP